LSGREQEVILVKRAEKIIIKINDIILRLDGAPLWLLGFALLAVWFGPYLLLGEGGIFEVHDQLDEYMMNNVLTARHLGEGAQVLPEMMGGVNASGLQPAAVLFVPLYRVLPEYWAFVLQYAVCFGAAFFGMYFCVRELTGSSLLALAGAGCFCMLPMYPVYGLSEMGIPLLFYGFLRLRKGRSPWTGLAAVLFFGLASHLVYTGYAVLSLWGLALVIRLVRKESWKQPAAGFLLLLGVYVTENHSLFWELLLGQGTYVSHRVEMVNYSMPFWDTVKNLFLFSAQHAPSLHRYLILPIAVLLAAEGICYKKLVDRERKRYLAALGGVLFLAGIALFYGLCKSEAFTAWKNGAEGFFHYFQVERYYWLYPAGWYLEFVSVFGIWWRQKVSSGSGKFWRWPLCRLAVLGLALLPTLLLIKENSYLYLNVNQINNGSGITGYISWESYYAEELMQKIENAIGRDMTSYRVAHLGMSPAPALMHGFYTVDGYSNNYPLEYKHLFRQVIARELEKNEQTRLYFDQWGNRCYLFNGATGTAWMLGKEHTIVYEKLEFDMDALRGLGCEYLFSCGEILNAEELGMEFMGCYETENSYWRVWLYGLGGSGKFGGFSLTPQGGGVYDKRDV